MLWEQFPEKLDLTDAIWCANADVVAKRLKEGHRVDWKAKRGVFPPMHHAAWKGHTAVLKILLGAGADVESFDVQKHTALQRAASGSHPANTKLLLGAGASVSETRGLGAPHWTTLHWAVSRWGESERKSAVAELLLDAGLDVNRPNKDETTLLRLAAKQGRLLFAKLLCCHGAKRSGDEAKLATGEAHAELAAWLTETADFTLEQHRERFPAYSVRTNVLEVDEQLPGDGSEVHTY